MQTQENVCLFISAYCHILKGKKNARKENWTLINSDCVRLFYHHLFDRQQMNVLTVLVIDQKLKENLSETDLLATKDDGIPNDIFQVSKDQLGQNHLIADFHKYLSITEQVENQLEYRETKGMIKRQTFRF